MKSWKHLWKNKHWILKIKWNWFQKLQIVIAFQKINIFLSLFQLRSDFREIYSCTVSNLLYTCLKTAFGD